MQAILLRQFRAWHELGPKDGNESLPRSGLTAKPCRPNPEWVLEAHSFHKLASLGNEGFTIYIWFWCQVPHSLKIFKNSEAIGHVLRYVYRNDVSIIISEEVDYTLKNIILTKVILKV